MFAAASAMKEVNFEVGKVESYGERPEGAGVEGRVRWGRETELEVAARVQQKMFPCDLPRSQRLRTLEYAGHCTPAGGVGGDYYDFLDASCDASWDASLDAGEENKAGSGERALSFVLADVAGKGIPAALLMANLQACFRSQSADRLRRPGAMLRTVNRQFHASTTPDRFATVFFGTYDDGTRVLRYVNCGHNPPLLLRGSGEMESLRATATMLGAFELWNCVEAEVRLEPGDTLLLYSDGVTEATNGNGDEFGETRLRAMLRDSGGEGPGSASGLVGQIAGAVTTFSGGARTDDVTLVAIRAV